MKSLKTAVLAVAMVSSALPAMAADKAKLDERLTDAQNILHEIMATPDKAIPAQILSGASCVVVAQAGISGSTRLDNHVVLAGQAGIAGHLTLGAGARVAAQSGVMRDVPAGQEVCGSPALPIKQFFKQVATLARLSRRTGTRTREE